jgi:orotate phosphoribosyltransferase
VAGTATAGIPHAAWVADRLSLPMVYVRAQAKAHGKSKQIEGGEVQERSVVVVEDLVTTGGSSLQTVNALRDAGGRVERCVSIFSYGFREADEAFTAAACTSTSLCDFEALLAASDTLDDAARAELLRWHADPHAWQPAEI